MRFQISRGNLGNINIVIMFYQDINKEKTEVSKRFWELSLNDAGISFQILPPTLKKALFWISSLDFLIQKVFDGGRPSAVRMNTSNIA